VGRCGWSSIPTPTHFKHTHTHVRTLRCVHLSCEVCGVDAYGLVWAGVGVANGCGCVGEGVVVCMHDVKARALAKDRAK